MILKVKIINLEVYLNQVDKTLRNKIINILFKTKRRKICTLVLFVVILFYIFAPYLFMFLGIKIFLNARSPQRRGFIDLPIGTLLVSQPLLWTGHHISPRGTVWMIDSGNDMEKELAVSIFKRWPRKMNPSKLITCFKAEKNPRIREGIIYIIGCCQNNKAIPFLEKLFRKGNSSALVAMCQMQTDVAEKKLLEIYRHSNNVEFKKIILLNGDHSLNFVKTVILEEKSLKMRLDAYWGYFASQDNKFHEKNKDSLWSLYEAFPDGYRYEDNFTSSQLIESFNKSPALSLDDKKFLLLGHAVLRSPKSIPFLKEISTKNKSEELRKLAKEILNIFHIPHT